MADSIATISVSSVVPAVTDKELAAANNILVSVRRNSTEKQPIPEGGRYRAIVIPKPDTSGVPSKFSVLVDSALNSIAAAQLKELWDDAEDGFTTVSAALWNTDSLLVYSARKSESQRLSGDTIAAWFAASVIRSRILKIEDDAKRAAQLKKYAEGFASVAAPVISRNEDECTQLLKLLDAEDQENIIVRQMCARLRNRINEMRKQRAECFAEELPE